MAALVLTNGDLTVVEEWDGRLVLSNHDLQIPRGSMPAWHLRSGYP